MTEDAWIEPVIEMVKRQRGERVAVTAICATLAGDSEIEAMKRLDHVIGTLKRALPDLGPTDARRKRTAPQIIAERAIDMMTTARADIQQLAALSKPTAAPGMDLIGGEL